MRKLYGGAKLPGLLFAGLLLLSALVNSIEVLKARANVMNLGLGDFRIFATAAHILVSGERSRLYDYETQADVQQQLYPRVALNRKPLPFNHPAFEALLFVPLAYLSPWIAYNVWNGLNLLLLFFSLCWLSPHLTQLRDGFRVPLLLWAVAFFPVARSFMLGQDSVLLLLTYALSYIALRNNRPALAGLALGFGSFKFHLVLPFVVLFFLWGRRWKALASFTATAGALAGVSIAVTGIEGARNFVVMQFVAPQRSPWFFDPDQMPNLRGIITFALASFTPGSLAAVSTAIASVGLFVVVAATLNRRESEDTALDLTFALSLTTTLLVSYHLFTHDLSPLLLALLLGCNYLAGESRPQSWVVTAAVVGFYAFPTMAALLDYDLRDIPHLSLLGWLVLMYAVGLILLLHKETQKTGGASGIQKLGSAP